MLTTKARFPWPCLTAAEATLARLDAVIATLPAQKPADYYGYGFNAGFETAQYEVRQQLEAARKGE